MPGILFQEPRKEPFIGRLWKCCRPRFAKIKHKISSGLDVERTRQLKQKEPDN